MLLLEVGRGTLDTRTKSGASPSGAARRTCSSLATLTASGRSPAKSWSADRMS